MCEIDRPVHPSRPDRSIAFMAVGVVLFLMTGGLGCSRTDGRVAVYPVKGVVSVESEVPEGALVVLYPVGAANAEIRPSAKVKPDGSFQLTTYESEDGAPVGEYVATLQWNKVIKKGNDYAAGPNIVPKAYASRETSPWKIKVEPSPTTLAPLAIVK